MKYFLASVSLIFCLQLFALDIDKETLNALTYIKQGFINYGFKELQIIAAKNDLPAQFYVAVCHENGIGTKKDLTNAFKMFRKAAERGLPDAMYRVASFYRDGIVVVQDATRESEWTQRFNKKGGSLLLPDMMPLYNEGLKHPENFALNPNGESNEHDIFTQRSDKNSAQRQTINNITIVQQISGPNENANNPAGVNNKEIVKLSDVDQDIPVVSNTVESSFALIIANEDYQEVEDVPNALNDGEAFAQYCEKTLGIPQSNIKYVSNATLNQMKRQVNWLTQVMDAHQGDVSVILYYAGHGIPNESNKSALLLPVDGVGSDVTTAYSLDKLYEDLNSKPSKSIFVFLDACFSGAKRDGGMLTSARGVAIRVNPSEPKGNLIVFSAAQGDETAYPYKEKGHGMFTYYLLKIIKETKGKVTMGEIADYVTSEVKKRSLIINSKMQTPSVTPSKSISNWRKMKLR